MILGIAQDINPLTISATKLFFGIRMRRESWKSLSPELSGLAVAEVQRFSVALHVSLGS